MSESLVSVDEILDKNETNSSISDRGIDLADDPVVGSPNSPMSRSDTHSTDDSFGHGSSEEEEVDIDEVQDGGGSGDSGVDTGIHLEEYLHRSNTMVIYPEAVDEDRRSDYKGEEDENGLEPVNCPYCDRTYKRLTSLKEHIKYRHEKGSNSFSCPKCNYCFAHKSQLERHMATHMPGRNQVCEICNKAFVNIYRLQRHMLTHTSGNRKFKCGECSKAFKYKHHLKEHLRIHSGEKPYECSICRKRFSHSGSYSSHISSKKCSPVHVPPIIKDAMAAPVKVVSGDVLPDSNEGSGKENNGHSVSNNISYFYPLHVKIPTSNDLVPTNQNFPDKQNQQHLTSPPNEAVKKVLEIVGATVTKQQQEGQNTDISKIKKTVNPTQEHIEIISPKVNTTEKVKLPEITKDRGVVTAKMVKAPLGTIPPQDDNYSIVDYTLKKVHEAKAVASCLETHRKNNAGSLEKAFCKFCGKFFENPIELHQHERYICTMNEEVQEAVSSMDPPPLLKSNCKEFCRLCGESFDSPIEKHQHERYLCDMNADVCRQKMRSNNNDVLSLTTVNPESDEKDTNEENNDDVSVINEEKAALSDDQTIEVESTKEDDCESEEDNPVAATEDQPEVESISSAQEQALRAFYALQAQPSEDGLTKISQALNLNVNTISDWFQKARQQEVDGTDPSLKGLEYANKTAFNGSVSDSRPVSNSPEPTPSPVRTSVVQSSPQRPTATTPEPTRDEDRGVDLTRLRPTPLTLQTTSPISSPQTSPSSYHSRPIVTSSPSTTAHDAPLDLSVPKRMSPTPEYHLDRNNLMFHYKYPSLYSPALGSVIYPGLRPPLHPQASLYFENTIKAHSLAHQVNKRRYPDPPYFAYLPLPNGYQPKRQRINVPPMDYPQIPEMMAAEAGLRKPGTIELSHSPTYPVHSPKGYPEDSHEITSSRMDYMYDDNCNDDSPGKQRRRDRVVRSVIGGLYACSQCPKTFQKHSSLLRHVYEHSGKRPHMCKECGKAFKHKHHLMEHSRLHSGEKPYQCDKCLKKFSHSGSYSQHMNHRYSYCKREDNLGAGFGRKKGATIKQIMAKEDYVNGLTEEVKSTKESEIEA
ncbi:zinc finger E-box-binding homeobox 1-like isoform X2 [Anneissia japonica]|uniref:zinc finger E-box-binding homeobox 1-like isoform X2 n=1 Tax=Anneissia japonica TaxID=1529436 RepID=UPI001425B87C|nr:zinc finger E-box-binding homeobox 1-like isoform X2 [Anneissia japonica]